MKIWYPWFSFSTEIKCDSIVENMMNNNGYGLLFSGGIDSTVSYLRHRDKKPNLVSVWGTGTYMHPEIEIVKKRLTDFANKEKTKVNFITSNIEEVLNFILLKEKYGLDWYVNVFHSLILTGMCAPLSCIENIQTVLLASSFTKEYNFPFGSHPYIDNNIRWADVQVVHDGYELTRQEKIRHVLKEYILKTGNYPFIRSCVRETSYNCGKCEKCYRTITGLILDNIDPNKCGFLEVNDETLELIKENLIQKNIIKKLPFVSGPKDIFNSAINGLSLKEFNYVSIVSMIINNTVTMLEWNDIQHHIPEKMDHNLFNAKEFYEWFKTFDVFSVKKTKSLSYHLLRPLIYCYYHLPDNIRRFIYNRFLRSIYNRL